MRQKLEEAENRSNHWKGVYEGETKKKEKARREKAEAESALTEVKQLNNELLDTQESLQKEVGRHKAAKKEMDATIKDLEVELNGWDVSITEYECSIRRILSTSPCK